MSKILVVDDEPYIRFFLERLLTSEGHEVVSLGDGMAALEAIYQPFDLALLDINLGRGPSGLDVLDALHQHQPDTAVILLTGQGTLETAVIALRHGAHDYLLKPCMADEIRHSVRQGLAKRHQRQKQTLLIDKLEQNIVSTLREIRGDGVAYAPTAVAPPPPAPPASHHSRLTVDKERHMVLVNKTPLPLTPIEFSILSYLVSQAPQVVTAQQLVYAIHQYRTDAIEASNIVRSHVYRLRQKIKDAGINDELIGTIRGVGYVIHG